MHFCVLKNSNWFFEFLWKEKICLLSAANIEYKNLEEKYHIDYYIAFFGTFLVLLRNSLRSGEKHEKTAFMCKYKFFLRNFHARCWQQIKDIFFLFTKIEKINSKALERKKHIQFINFPRLLRPVSDCSINFKAFKTQKPIHFFSFLTIP